MIGRAAGVAALLAGFATLAIVLLISYDVAMRYFFDQPQLFVDEVASFLELLVVFGGAAYTFRVGGHVRVDLVTQRIRPAARAWLRVVTLALGIAFLAVVIWVRGTTARDVTRGTTPYVILMVVLVVLLFLVPDLALWLPRHMTPPR